MNQMTMLDRLAIDCSDLLTRIEQQPESEHMKIIKNHIKDIIISDKYEAIPDFDTDLDWFNVSVPLSFTNQLKGKVVLLDFFTYCCINCLHILPHLKKFEKQYPIQEGLVIVGVHSAKFTNEKDSTNVQAAIKRHQIDHPVVNDLNNGMWNKLQIQCWPTMLIVGPDGKPLFVIMGESHSVITEKYIKASLEYYNAAGQLKLEKIIEWYSNDPFKPADQKIPGKIESPTNLNFPGKIQCLKYSLSDINYPELYAMSDSGNNRIIIFDAKGMVLFKIGSSDVSGLIDGNFDKAAFNFPQGVAFVDENTVIVADTDNNAIRKIKLRERTVETIVGTGKQGTDFHGGAIGNVQDISSPWDVVVYKTKNMDMSFHVDDSEVEQKNVLLIAMAGTHQIWAHFLEKTIWWRYRKLEANQCVAIAGSGEERNRNNNYPHQASFAQPSGLALLRETGALIVADSESSSVRKMALADGKVTAIVGGNVNPMNLFAFGDVDGEKFNAKLQHPLGVTHHPTTSDVYVADTYNHKIKRINTLTNAVETLAIMNEETNELYKFNEPSGLCASPDGKDLFVLNTNDHEIVKVNLTTLTAGRFELNWSQSNAQTVIKLPVQAICIDTRFCSNRMSLIKVPLHLTFTSDVKLTPNSLQSIKISFTDPKWDLFQFNERQFFLDLKQDITIQVPEHQDIPGKIILHFLLLLCSVHQESCFKKEFSILVPVELDSSTAPPEPIIINVGIDQVRAN